MIIKEYNELGIRCTISSGECKIEGANGRYKILEEWLSVYRKTFWLGDDTTTSILSDMECVIRTPELAKRMYRYRTGWDICGLEFSRKSPYAIITVKYPLGTHIAIARMRTHRIPITIFHELLTLAEATKTDEVKEANDAQEGK